MERFQIYLAGPCGNEPDEGMGWREKAATIFNDHVESNEYKIVVVDPTKYFTYADRKDHETDKQIKQFYLSQILRSNVVLCALDRSKMSPGTAQEIQFAVDHKIPVIGWGREDIYPWLEVDCQVTFPSMLQAIDYIKEYYIERR